MRERMRRGEERKGRVSGQGVTRGCVMKGYVKRVHSRARVHVSVWLSGEGGPYRSYGCGSVTGACSVPPGYPPLCWSSHPPPPPSHHPRCLLPGYRECSRLQAYSRRGTGGWVGPCPSCRSVLARVPCAAWARGARRALLWMPPPWARLSSVR